MQTIVTPLTCNVQILISKNLCARSTPPSLRNRSVAAERADMLEERSMIQRLGQHIGMIEVGGHVVDDDIALRHELAHLKIATLDVARALARLHVLGELNCPLVVHVQNGWLELAPKLKQQAAEVHDLGGGLRCGHDLFSASVEDRAMLCCRLLP